MYPLLMIAGLSQEMHQKVSSYSAKKFAPNGKLISKPLCGNLDETYANELLQLAYQTVTKLDESLPISLQLICVSDPLQPTF